MAMTQQWDLICLLAFIAVVLLCCFLFTGCGPSSAQIEQFKVEASANLAAFQSRIETGDITVPVSVQGVGFGNLALIFGFLYAMKSIPSKTYRAVLRPDKMVRGMLKR